MPAENAVQQIVELLVLRALEFVDVQSQSAS
jgi:hypothetical protein